MQLHFGPFITGCFGSNGPGSRPVECRLGLGAHCSAGAERGSSARSIHLRGESGQAQAGTIGLAEVIAQSWQTHTRKFVVQGCVRTFRAALEAVLDSQGASFGAILQPHKS